MTRRRVLQALGLAVLLAALVPGVSLAREQAPPVRKVVLVANAVSTFVEGSSHPCAPAPPGTTLAAVRVGSTWGADNNGTMQGSNVTEACVYVAADGSMTATGVATFTGSIVGCGSGTMRFSVVGKISAPDPVTGIRTSRDEARFVPSSDSGAIDVVAASYTLTGRAAPDLSLTGQARGAMACR